MLHRRTFLKRSAFISLAPTVPHFLSRTAAAAETAPDDTILVVVQLDGGNDGLNTVIPHADDAYHAARPSLRVEPDRVIPLADGIGLHPALRPLDELWQAGHLSVVQGVGYPNPDRSHFRSMAIWQTARLDAREEDSVGWLGRACDGTDRAGLFYVGDQAVPVALRGTRSVATAIRRLEDWRLPAELRSTGLSGTASADSLQSYVREVSTRSQATAEQLREMAGRPSPRRTESRLDQDLSTIARLIGSGAEARVYYAVQGGYDTHVAQANLHAGLLAQLAGAVRNFFATLHADGTAERVVLMTFSEFGRRVQENDGRGTDHGAAGPMLLVGPAVRGGLHGEHPSLTDLDAGDLKPLIDFRCVYASALDDWLGIPSRETMGGHFNDMRLFSA